MSQTTARFDLQTRLAAGNAGLVYRGIEKATRRRVALKLLIDTGLPHPLDGEALLRDAARIRRTAGNNIAQLLEVIPDEEVGMVLVYEYADGLNWTDAAKERRLDAAQAVDVAAQFLSALAVGEAIHVPHGELKPMNLVLGDLPGGRLLVWVLDWGLSAYRPAPPEDALPWLSPERLAGAPASTEADLFAMGACLCWLLTGTVPVAGETREQLAAGWRKFPANALAQVRPDLPARFTRWVGTLLDANPRGRFATVAQARQALATLDPPSPPVLPEIFRPRPKSPYSTVAPARTAIVPRAVPQAVPRVVPRVVAVPAENPSLEENHPPPADELVGEPEAELPQREPPPESEPVEEDETTLADPELAAAPPEETEAEPAEESAPEWTGAAEASPEPVVVRPRTGRWLAVLAALVLAGGGASFFLPRSADTISPDELDLAPPAPAAPGLAAAAPAMLQVTGQIAEENFAYGPGTRLSGQNGGTGWSGPWENSTPPLGTIRAGSLTNGQPTPGGPGGHLTVANPRATQLHRALGPRGQFFDEAKGGTWWCGFLLAHSGPPAKGVVYELHCNLFSAANLDDIIRLTFTEGDGRLTVTSLPARGSATLPGPAHVPQRILVRLTAKPAGDGSYHVKLDLWANPDPARLGAPLLGASADKAVLPRNLGVRWEKKATKASSTTLLDALRFGRDPQAVL